MGRSLILGILIICCSVAASAQVMINVQLPTYGVMAKSQLWNMVLMNSSPQPIKVSINLYLSEASVNRGVLSASTRTITLLPGANTFTGADLAPISYRVLASGYAINEQADGFLPIGQFNVCYTVINQMTDAMEQLADQCEWLTVEPIHPPQLVNPLNQEQIQVSRPVFTWTPPMPIQLFGHLVYDLVLVDLRSLQSPVEAIQRNIPILKMMNQTTTQFQYPSTLPALDTGKWYAWQIVAKSYFAPVANSEVFLFRYQPGDMGKSDAKPVQLYRVAREESAAVAVMSDSVKFEFESRSSDTLLTARMVDLQSASRKELVDKELQWNIRPGINILSLSSGQIALLKDKRMYMLLFNNDKSQYYLKFLYLKSK